MFRHIVIKVKSIVGHAWANKSQRIQLFTDMSDDFRQYQLSGDSFFCQFGAAPSEQFVDKANTCDFKRYVPMIFSQSHHPRVRVTKDQLGSGKLTVKLPWDVANSQACQTVPSDGYWARLSCVVSSLPPIFLLNETSRTSFELLVSCFLLKTFILSSWS